MQMYQARICGRGITGTYKQSCTPHTHMMCLPSGSIGQSRNWRGYRWLKHGTSSTGCGGTTLTLMFTGALCRKNGQRPQGHTHGVPIEAAAEM